MDSQSGSAKKKQKKVFSAEEEEMIILHYQANECLWNPTHEHYKFGWKSSSVQELADAMGNKFTRTYTQF